MKKIMFAAMVFVLLALTLFPPDARGHNPSSMGLDYDFDSQELTVDITHTVASTTNHYIDAITVYRNDIPVIEEEYTSQPDSPSFTIVFDVTAVDGDVLRVYAHCNQLNGEIEEETTVVGKRDYMTLVLNPMPDEVEIDEEIYMTVNVYREDDGTPLDGVELVPKPTLGFIGDVSDLGMGAYGFTYEAPDLESEDIEVMNISCTKNGYHPLYFEVAFDIVLAADDSRDINVVLDPVVYTMDEGSSKTFTVQVKVQGEELDIPDIDVDYSYGRLSKEADGTGRFKLTYTADLVDSDTTAFIRVTASMTGYNTGSYEIQFKIIDRGDTARDDDDENNDRILWYLSGGIIVIFLIIIVVILVRRKKSRDEYEDVRVAEVIGENDRK